MLTVGLTGGIAAGKSHVLRRFAAAGFRTIDLDRVSRDVMAPGGAAYGAVVGAFGRAIVAADGTIDRRELGRLVFADADARRRLESIVHPAIRAAEQALLGEATGAAAVVDAALLVETGAHLRFDRLVVVHCEPREQLRRLMARDGLPEAAARARIAAQMPAGEKRGFAHYVIDASGSRAATDLSADAVIAAVGGLAAAPWPRVPVDAARAVAMMERGPRDGPCGLAPWPVAGAIAAEGNLDLQRLGRALEPPHAGAWYEAARSPAQPPESLAVPVAIWCAGRRPGDPAFTIAAASSLARLTHRDPAAVAGAIVAAVAAQHALAGGSGSSLASAVPAWTEAATAWAGSAPPSSVVQCVLAAAAHPGDSESAARTALAAGGLASLAGALAGGPIPAPAAADRLSLVRRLLGAAAV